MRPMPRVVTFGEAMLRLSAPGRRRLEQAHALDVWPAGAELNVAIGLARLGTEAAWVSRLPDNALGRLVAAHARAHGVDLGGVLWAEEGRLGLYFTEIGEGARPSAALYDRAASAFAQLDPGDLDWQALFEGADALAVSGITPALSAACADATAGAVAAAREAGALVAYDVNLRRRLTTPEDARATLERLAGDLDVLVASTTDALALFPEADGADIPTALRERLGVSTVVVSAGDDVTRTRTAAGETTETVTRPHLPATEPIGSGDAFCAGFLHGLVGGRSLREALALGDALSALKLSIPGDAPVVTPEEVESALGGRAEAGVRR